MAVMETGDFRRLIKTRLLVGVLDFLPALSAPLEPQNQQQTYLLVVRRWRCSEALALLVLQTGVCLSWTLSAHVSCHTLVKFLRSWIMAFHVSCWLAYPACSRPAKMGSSSIAGPSLLCSGRKHREETRALAVNLWCILPDANRQECPAASG